ncbi:hypothetical protein [Methylocapsa sp. S129]|uniref:hypothetical protein n=1 Tax=Methylocapsa sp. S129 TaxID=1641869 RepID=UPI00131B42E8|nr:hypothetical protein [Methylocapsa sp. S129]
MLLDHVGEPVQELAASIARAVSALPQSGTAPNRSPVAGLSMVSDLPLSAAIHWPGQKPLRV